MAARSPLDFGRNLREARERRGVSLRQIANATKIGMSALEALERNDFSRLPGGIFSRAFVRSYAIEVGLDPEATMQEFIAQFPSDSVAAARRPMSPQAEDHQAIDSDRRAATTFVWLFTLSIPIVGAVLYFETAGRHSAPAVPDAPPAVTSTAPIEAPTETVETLPEPIEAPATAPVVEPASAARFPSDRLTVGLLAIGECWVSVTVDGGNRIERLLQPREELAIEVHRELVLTAGDASALAITLNGAAAKPLGPPGRVATARLNLTNFKDYLLNP